MFLNAPGRYPFLSEVRNDLIRPASRATFPRGEGFGWRSRLPSPLGKVAFGENACVFAERRMRSPPRIVYDVALYSGEGFGWRSRLPSPLGKVTFGENACVFAERRMRSPPRIENNNALSNAPSCTPCRWRPDAPCSRSRSRGSGCSPCAGRTGRRSRWRRWSGRRGAWC